MRKTKIICTLGPSTDNENIIRDLILCGMNVARINTSHGDLLKHKKRVDIIKKIREELNLPVALLLDTRGPEIRLKKIENESVVLKNGQKFVLTTRKILGNEKICSVTFKDLPKDVKKNTKIFLNDGLLELKVEKIDQTDVVCEVTSGGVLYSSKGINIPNVRVSLPFLSSEDLKDIEFAVKEDFDFIAASFTRNERDIEFLREYLKEHKSQSIKLIAKIENFEGVKNVDSIIKASDGVMVGRGDLGTELPMEDVPIIQKYLIKKAIAEHKDAIVATEMLESMIKNLRPTRAECSDVANAIFDGASAVMLSGETASGNYPIEALSMMSKIAKRAEKEVDYQLGFNKNTDRSLKMGKTSATSHAACTISHDVRAVAIMALTKAGDSSHMISSFKPNATIIGVTNNKKVYRQMGLSWGVSPILINNKVTEQEFFNEALQISISKKLVKKGDTIIVSANTSSKFFKSANIVKIHKI
ncbi:MAG: pyruvate kinase [Oscillospiraceae bacterium]|jgi:pyruvate kinase|nr:pyruvate kinase [Oscillospiraceae bacterium]